MTVLARQELQRDVRLGRRRRGTVLDRIGREVGSRRRGLLWLLPLLVGSGVLQAWGMGRAPQRIDDEGTYTAQAYAVQYFGELAHYTYWYDHPPLGWLQISAWTALTDAFGRTAHAVTAGREAMLVAHLAATALLWLLARRAGLGRPYAALAVAVYVLSPLAVSFHRMVYLDNVATPWLLAAFVLAASRRHQLVAFSGAAACFVLAVLSKETYLLTLPPWIWWMWRHAEPTTRRYTLTVSGSLLTLLGLGYATFAVLKGELLPGSRHVSLLDGILFQLAERPGSGSVLDRNSQAGDTVEIWLQLDPVLPVVATAAAIGLLFVRRVRPLAATYLLLLAGLLRPGYLPVPYVVAMIPFAAVLVALALQACVRAGTARRIAGVAAAVVVATAAAPAWGQSLHTLVSQDLDRPMRQAEQWLLENTRHGDRLLVDDAIWVDLVRSGHPRENVVWYYKADTDPEVMASTRRGWRDYDYVMATEAIRQSVAIDRAKGQKGAYPAVVNAYEHSTPVAEFGEGNQRVEIRRVIEGLPGDRELPRGDGKVIRPAPPRPEEDVAEARVEEQPAADTPERRPEPSAAPTTEPAPTPTPTPAPPPPEPPNPVETVVATLDRVLARVLGTR